MDVNMVVQLINGVGFPIAACIAMGGYLVWSKKQCKEKDEKISENTKEMIDKLSQAVENNTLAITRLVERLERDEK